jgi:hypothetical protein
MIHRPVQVDLALRQADREQALETMIIAPAA